MDTPDVSIIMPAFNDAQYIQQAINSVQAQAYENWELIIIDDGSNDETLNIILTAAKADGRIHVIQHPKNVGLTQSLNDGLAVAQAELIARLDSDDYWTNVDKLSQQIEFMLQHADYALVGTQGLAVDEQNNTLFTLSFPQSDEAIRAEILKHNCFIHSSVVFRTSVVRSLGGYKNTYGYVEDYELWLLLGTRYKFAVLPLNAVSYRINSKGLTQTRAVPQWKAFISLMKQYRTYYPGFYPAYVKLSIQTLALQLFGPKFLNRIKKQFISI